MILTKSKILAAALVACGVAGSSMGVSAQFGGEAQRTKVEAERLDQVEKKLDRVLQALEAKAGQPPASPTTPEVADPPSPPKPTSNRSPFDPDRPKPPKPPKPPEPPTLEDLATLGVTIQRSNSSVDGKKGEVIILEKDGQRMVLGPSSITFRKAGPPADAFQDDISRKIEGLEARLTRLEQKLGIGPAGSNEPPHKTSTSPSDRLRSLGP